MGAYQLLEDPTAFLRAADGVVIHLDPRGLDPDYVAFQAWLDAGHTPDPLAGPTLPERADTMLGQKIAAGLVITAPASLAGTYAIDTQSQNDIFRIGVFCAQFGTFPGGATQSYPDINSVPHTFTVAQFVALLRIVAPLVSALNTQAAMMGQGATPDWPAQTGSIP